MRKLILLLIVLIIPSLSLAQERNKRRESEGVIRLEQVHEKQVVVRKRTVQTDTVVRGGAIKKAAHKALR